jgi:hypothetical protein
MRASISSTGLKATIYLDGRNFNLCAQTKEQLLDLLVYFIGEAIHMPTKTICAHLNSLTETVIINKGEDYE